jgi:hypothetical protein
MRSQVILGVVLLLSGLFLLYLLRGLLFDLIILALEFIGLLIAFAFIVGGIGLIFWSRRGW